MRRDITLLIIYKLYILLPLFLTTSLVHLILLHLLTCHTLSTNISKRKLSILHHIYSCFVLLAAPSHNRCTSLVCSCYVASRNSYSQEDQENNSKKHLATVKKLDGNYIESSQRKVASECINRRPSKPHSAEPTPLKSNLRKASTLEINQLRSTGARKVSWSDAHGKDIAHIQEFVPSNASEDGELEGVRNSCMCVIQ